ncbi:MAG: hypothetical protein OER95_08930 [Acidimicrobiia bacterium]|nr:hypothetical protein [Acidimicrobiia bacterium]
MRPDQPLRSRGPAAGAALGLAAIMAPVVLAGCGGDKAAAEHVEPYELTEVEEGINKVVLTPRASERLLMDTAPVTEETVDGQPRLGVPYASLIYDTTGGTWVYIHPEPLTYLRAEVTVDRIEGDMVYLHDGPEPGAEVAITSVAELYGADTGVGK